MSETVLTEAKIMAFVATAQPEDAKRFYGETLGLHLLDEDGYSITFLVDHTTTLRVQKVQELTPQGFTVFGWQIDSLEEAVQELSTRGITFEQYRFPFQDERGICTFPNGDKVAWFKDPDGNTLSLAQIPGS